MNRTLIYYYIYDNSVDVHNKLPDSIKQETDYIDYYLNISKFINGTT